MIRSMMGRKKVDRNTLLLLHFDGSLKDEASGKPYVGSNMSYVVGKFKNCVSVFRKRVCKDKWNECHKRVPISKLYRRFLD